MVKCFFFQVRHIKLVKIGHDCAFDRFLSAGDLARFRSFSNIVHVAASVRRLAASRFSVFNKSEARMACNLHVKVRPVVLFQICDAYERRNIENHRVIGTLLGEKGNTK